jgi:hypothetical protein
MFRQATGSRRFRLSGRCRDGIYSSTTIISREVGKMNTNRTTALIAVVVLGAVLGGCCGGGTTVQPTPVSVTSGSNATLGQQLIELQKAYESGAITEAEYKKLKQDAIDKSKK